MINKVYSIVQNLLNKNGYGILSPTRFVLFAIQAQISILMESISQYRRETDRNVRSRSDASLKVYESVLETFTETATLSRVVDNALKPYHALPDDYLEFEQAFLDDVEVVKIPSRKKKMYERSILAAPTEKEPMCYIEGQRLYTLPKTIGVINDAGTDRPYDELDITYYRYPADPNWTFVEDTDGNPMFNASSNFYQDFELPYSMLPKLVLEILGAAGLHLRAEYVNSYVANEDAEQFNKENQ